MRADPALGAVFSADDEHLFRAGNPQAEITLIEGAAHSIHDRSRLPSYLHHLDAAVTAFAARAHGGHR